MFLTSIPFAENPTANYGKSETPSARAARGAPGRGWVASRRSARQSICSGARDRGRMPSGPGAPTRPAPRVRLFPPARRGRSRARRGDGSERPPSGDGRVFRHWTHRTQQLFLYSGSRPPSRRRGAHAPCVTAPFRPGADECCHSVIKVMGDTIYPVRRTTRAGALPFRCAPYLSRRPHDIPQKGPCRCTAGPARFLRDVPPASCDAPNGLVAVVVDDLHQLGNRMSVN